MVAPDPNDNAVRIDGGRLYQRLHLVAVTKGPAMQPLSQLTERIDREKVLSAAPGFADAVADLI